MMTSLEENAIRKNALSHAFTIWEEGVAQGKKVYGIIEVQRRVLIANEIGNSKLASDITRILSQIIEKKPNAYDLIEINVSYPETASMFKRFARFTRGKMQKIKGPDYEGWEDYGNHPNIKTNRSRAWTFIKFASLAAMKKSK